MLVSTYVVYCPLMSLESLRLHRDPTSQPYRKSVLNIHWKDWCWSWNSNTLAIWCEELTHLKRPWCWKWLKAGGEVDDRVWDVWMASPMRWTWVWVGSRSWWWTGRPGVLQSMGSQRVKHDWATELNWMSWSWASLVAQLVKNLLAMQETWVGSLGWEDLLEKGMATTAVFWPREFHGLCSPWGHTESDMTEPLSLKVLELSELNKLAVKREWFLQFS